MPFAACVDGKARTATLSSRSVDLPEEYVGAPIVGNLKLTLAGDPNLDPASSSY
jgi:hypothetical protein